MKEKLYLQDNVAIINFDLAYPATIQDLVGSKTLGQVIAKYLKHLKEIDLEQYEWLTNGCTIEETCKALSRVFRQLMVLLPNEIDDYYLNDKERLLEFVEGIYNYWKSHQRFSLTRQRYSGRDNKTFVIADSSFNTLLRSAYRSIEETLRERTVGVFRQLQAGTNAAISTYRPHEFMLSKKYEQLSNISLIESVMLRTPMIISTKSNTRSGMFEETKQNPIEYFSGDKDTWLCYPAKVGNMLINIYFHRDFMCSGVSLANLFELASSEESCNKPDAIVLFANEDGKDETVFYYDQEEDLWIGSISYNQKVEYFGYMKKMTLTLHNLAMMKKGWLPIHGAFANITLYDGKHKGIMLMGDSGAGKSESIEALKALGNDVIKDIEIVFDDMGTIHIEDGIPYGQGSEIGAFIRLDDLDAGTPYRDMDRSIFFNPDAINARVITPAAPYNVISKNHKIDLFCYANNYDKELGMREIVNMEEAKPIFIEGKRMAKGTTNEVGLSTTYFANPFGPMQKKEICAPIIDKVFDCLKANGIYVGEIFTHLGRGCNNRDGLNVAAQKLLAFMQKG